MNEQQLKKLIIDWLTMRRHFVWVNNTGLTRATYTNKLGESKERVWRAGVPGSSDILGIANTSGRFIAIECKVGSNKPTDLQYDFLQEINARGGIGIVAYSLDDIINDGRL